MKQGLLSLRKEIDRIDGKLLDLLSKRMKIAEKVAKYKKINKLRISHPKREKEILNKLKKRAKNKKINARLVESVYKNIMKCSKQIQRKCLK